MDMTGHNQDRLSMAKSALDSLSVTEADLDKRVLRVEAVLNILNAAGVRRNPRAISRYCEKQDLVCQLDSNILYITPKSVLEIIPKLIEIDAQRMKIGHGQVIAETPPVMPSHAETQPDMTKTVEDTKLIEEKEKLEIENGDLKKKLFDLEVTNKAKEMLVDQFTKERKEMLTMMQENAHRIGTLETQLQQLMAPKQNEQ